LLKAIRCSSGSRRRNRLCLDREDRRDEPELNLELVLCGALLDDRIEDSSWRVARQFLADQGGNTSFVDDGERLAVNSGDRSLVNSMNAHWSRCCRSARSEPDFLSKRESNVLVLNSISFSGEDSQQQSSQFVIRGRRASNVMLL
jgi:hypothetical protein